MNNLLIPCFTAFAKYAKKNFIRKTHRVDFSQEQFLHILLKTYKDTEFGRQYGLKDIKTIEQFQQRIPVLPYSSYEPYTERIAQGKTNVLTSDPVVYITLTSGSTGNKKMLPITRRSQNVTRQATLTSMGFLIEALEKRRLKFGKMLITNSTQVLGLTSGGIEYGPSSTGVLRMDRHLYKQFFANPYETLHISDSFTRHYICWLFALRDMSMRGMIANFPMLILRTCNYLEQYAEELIRDIQKGTIANHLKLEPEIRALLERQWSAHPSRAAQLQEILKSEGRLTPKLALPQMSFVATARGGTSDFYFERFPTYFEDTPTFGAVYSSAESIFSVFPDVNQDASVLAIGSSFFEFIPKEEWEADNPKTLLATEVKVGEYYRIVTTNYNGLYRYDVGDIVEVVGFYNQAPLIVFRYRRGGFICSTTEKTTEFHVTQVMQALQQEFNLHLEDFCITLSENDFPACYLVNIELANGHTLSNPQAFLARFDRKLKEINIYYEVKRRDQIPAPRLRILSPLSFATLRQRHLQQGIPDSQLKFPHISENRYFLAGLPVQHEVKLPEDLDTSRELLSLNNREKV